ncbi:hypothetical protein [Hymenobacter sp. B1770]|uniref:hypothetical protein n=1 Tax=Hymenobacter sp. B1770 TaxID=1718788 RepID=UPI003CF5E84F
MPAARLLKPAARILKPSSRQIMARDPFRRLKAGHDFIGEIFPALNSPATKASGKYLPKSLELLEEIQLTDDIFFPYSWLLASLGSFQTAGAASVVRAFLQAQFDYNPPLRAKLQQASDDLCQAEKLVR